VTVTSGIDGFRLSVRNRCAKRATSQVASAASSVAVGRWRDGCSKVLLPRPTMENVTSPCASTTVLPPDSTSQLSPGRSTTSSRTRSSVSHSVPRVTRSVAPRMFGSVIAFPRGQVDDGSGFEAGHGNLQ
jgi:hypothetical protein